MKIRVGLLCGGKSAEHQVSLQSARNIVDAIDKEKYEVILIGIDKVGQWFLEDSPEILMGIVDDGSSVIIPSERAQRVVLVQKHYGVGQLLRMDNQQALASVDVVFPVLHGPFGEDGTVQGMLKLFNIPFVGSEVLGSAVGMDKDVMKRLLRDAGIPGPGFQVVSRREEMDFDRMVENLGLPVFVKPANLGSSVGVNRVNSREEFFLAMDEAFRYDSKVIVEEFVEAREIECSILGNEDPIASVPGEVIPRNEFYSFEAKYLDENGADLKIPATLSEATIHKIQTLALQSFRVLCCQGMARVDFFLRKDGEVLVNELNTIPGFTRISMFPKLWEASGISSSKLVCCLIELAQEKFINEQKLETSYKSKKEKRYL